MECELRPGGPCSVQLWAGHNGATLSSVEDDGEPSVAVIVERADSDTGRKTLATR